MNIFRLIFLLIISIQFLACSKKNVSKIEEVTSSFVMPELNSTVNLNYFIDKDAINDTFNIIIDKYLDTDLQIDAMGMDVKITKEKDASIEILGTQVLSTLPIKISVSKSTFLKDISGNGHLELKFITGIDIDSSWNLVTKTELATHDWIEKPKLSLAGLQINISRLADEVINRSKPTLEKQIDLAVNDQIALKDNLLDLLKYVEEPILIDTIVGSWIHVQPNYIYMSHIQNESQFASGNITIHGKTKFSSLKPNVIPGIKLPKFRWEPTLDDTSHINVVLDVSYDQVNNYLKENYQNKTLESDGKEITIHSLELKRDKDKLIVVSDISGSVNGQLLVSGKPVFDNNKQKFYTEDVDINIKTKNVIHKAGAWLFKSKIKNKLKGMLEFSVADNLTQLQQLIDDQVSNYSVQDEIELKADLRNLHIERFALDHDKLHAFVTLNVYLQTKIYNINSLSNPSYFKLKN